MRDNGPTAATTETDRSFMHGCWYEIALADDSGIRKSAKKKNHAYCQAERRCLISVELSRARPASHLGRCQVVTLRDLYAGNSWFLSTKPQSIIRRYSLWFRMSTGGMSALIYHREDFRVSRSSWHRLSKPLAVLLGCIVLSGCSGEENIQLKKLDPKVDSILGDVPKDYKEKRPAFARKGSSSKIGRDPSGVNPNRSQQ
jgi:hypothetical protein